MLFLLSPAKSLDYDSPVPAPLVRRTTEPLFVPRAAELIAVLNKKTPAQVAGLMDLSDPLAALNAARYAAWQPESTPDNSKPAVLASTRSRSSNFAAPNTRSRPAPARATTGTSTWRSCSGWRATSSTS